MLILTIITLCDNNLSCAWDVDSIQLISSFPFKYSCANTGNCHDIDLVSKAHPKVDNKHPHFIHTENHNLTNYNNAVYAVTLRKIIQIIRKSISYYDFTIACVYCSTTNAATSIQIYSKFILHN